MYKGDLTFKPLQPIIKDLKMKIFKNIGKRAHMPMFGCQAMTLKKEAEGQLPARL